MKILTEKKEYFFIGLAVVAVGVEFLFPGNVPFLRDEALLIRLALDANEAGTLAPHGLTGTVGVSYGALVVWFNQLMLIFTDQPVCIAAVKTFLSAGISLVALWKMAALWRLPLSPAAALWFCSPFVFFYNRAVWDNVWLLPLSLGFFCCAAHYWRGSGWRCLAGAALLLDAMVYLHLAALPLPVAFAVTVVILRWHAPRREWMKILGIGAGALLLISPYLWQIMREFAPMPLPPQPANPAAELCFTNLTGSGFLERFAPEHASFFWFAAAAAAAAVIAGFILLGLLALNKARRKREWTSFDSTALLAAVCIVCYMAMIFLLGHPHQTHYNSAVTAAWFILAWHGYASLRSDYRKSAQVALGAALSLQLALIGWFMLCVEEGRGTTSVHIGPVMSEQCRAAEFLLAAYRKNPQLEVELQIERFRQEPESLQLLIKLAERRELPDVPVFQRLTVGSKPQEAEILLIGEEQFSQQ